MSLKNYGVLKGRPIDRRLAITSNAHYQVHIVDDDTDYRIAINVKSKLFPSELQYWINENFTHPLIDNLPKLSLGFHELERKPGGKSLDFIRGNLIPERNLMTPLAFDVPGLDNDLNEKIDRYIQRAMADEDVLIYAFGERWGPESKKDKIFGFQPGNGIHDIHMNQGNAGDFKADDGVYQDGALLIQFPQENQWVGIFLKFQSQCWHTDDKTGHCLMVTPDTSETDQLEPDKTVRLIAALVNPSGPDKGEKVTLLNTSPQSIDLNGWRLADKNKNKHSLSGKLEPGATTTITLPQTIQLSNQGGIITLLNSDGIKVDGVAYTREQASREGWTIVF